MWWWGDNDERSGSFIGVNDHIPVDLEFTLFVGIDKEFTISELEAEVDRIDLDSTILGFRTSLISISESDKGLNLNLFFSVDPLDDAEESTNNVAMNGEEKVSVGLIESAVVKEVGSAEVLPPGGLELLVNEGVDIVDGELLRGLYDQVLWVGDWDNQTQHQDDGDSE